MVYQWYTWVTFINKLLSNFTFTSMSPTFDVDLIIGRPTNDGKMNAGKLDPA